MRSKLTYEQFVALIKERFKIEKYSVYKQKASDLMIDTEHGSGSIVGPDAGYSIHYSYWVIELSGWSYLLADDCEWLLIPNGTCGWRSGENPFPEIPEPECESDWRLFFQVI